MFPQVRNILKHKEAHNAHGVVFLETCGNKSNRRYIVSNVTEMLIDIYAIYF